MKNYKSLIVREIYLRNYFRMQAEKHEEIVVEVQNVYVKRNWSFWKNWYEIWIRSPPVLIV